MAKDRVIGFLHDLVGDPKLSKQVSGVEESPMSWVAVAKENGYDFSVEDLKVVSEEIAQKPLEQDNFIPDLVGAMTLTSGNGDHASENGGNGTNGGFAFSPKGIARLKAVMQQGRYSGYYRPW